MSTCVFHRVFQTVIYTSCGLNFLKKEIFVIIFPVNIVDPISANYFSSPFSCPSPGELCMREKEGERERLSIHHKPLRTFVFHRTLRAYVCAHNTMGIPYWIPYNDIPLYEHPFQPKQTISSSNTQQSPPRVARGACGSGCCDKSHPPFHPLEKYEKTTHECTLIQNNNVLKNFKISIGLRGWNAC